MGKRPTPDQVAWQEAARERVRLVLARRYDANQTRLAHALGVSHTLVNLVVRGGQPPTRNLMARLGVIEGVNPRWADTGEGEPFTSGIRGTLPVSGVLLPGPPTDHAMLLSGERFTAPSAFDRESCYFWRVPPDHPATGVADWRLRSGDLALLETAAAVTSNASVIDGKMCVLDGRCLGAGGPTYGAMTRDEKQRLIFVTDRPLLRCDSTLAHPNVQGASPAGSSVPQVRPHGRKRRTIRNLDREEAKAAERAADPWYALPTFGQADVIAVQLLMVRP